MSKAHSLSTVRFGAVFCLSLLPLSGWSQQAPKAHTASVTTTDAKSGPLAGNRRLDGKQTIRVRSRTVEDVLEQLHTLSGVEFHVRHTGIRVATLSLAYQKAPLRDILDDIAGAGGWEWRQEREGALLLQFRYDPHRQDFLRPHTEADAERERRGFEFLGQLGRQPASLQEALTRSIKDPDNNGVAFGDLPPEMQQNLRAMLAAQLMNLGEDFQNLKAQLQDPQTARLYLQVDSKADTTEYSITFGVPAEGGSGCLGSTEVNFSVFNDSREDYHVVPMSEVNAHPQAPWSPAQTDDASRQAALTADARLKGSVTLNLQEGTLADALLALLPQKGINFVAVRWPDSNASLKKSLVIKAAPLQDALDQVAATFHYTWGERKSGTFIFHPLPEKPGPTART